jgi:sugar (pentulose or hexulose) kinase
MLATICEANLAAGTPRPSLESLRRKNTKNTKKKKRTSDMELKNTAIGIELGSTRIKGVLIDEKGKILAQGDCVWENRFENGLWTYSLQDIQNGLQVCYANLKADVKQKFGITLHTTGAIGISAMMHGYMVFDKNDRLLTPFRTWRNNNAEGAAKELCELFDKPIPARWSIAHLYQAILNGEPHVKDIAFQTTLEGYVHYLLTGKKVIGVGEASGMFPLGADKKSYDEKCKKLFNDILHSKGFAFTLDDIFPEILLAGEEAGTLTKAGANFLDPTGELQAGIPLCPPEGDAGTGMVATNSVKTGTGNVSAGTSIFGMIVLNKSLQKRYSEIDIVATPAGEPVAMVHCNNCTSEMNAWVELFYEYSALTGRPVQKGELYTTLLTESLQGEEDCGGVGVCNYLSGENITEIQNGRPMVVRTTESRFTLANFMRAQVYACFITLKGGMDILFGKEGITAEKIYAHGGLFKTDGVAQKYLAAALNTPVAVMETAGEGGAWGMALLAMFALKGKKDLPAYLQNEIFVGAKEKTELPDGKTVAGVERFAAQFKKVLQLEKTASEVL